MRTSTLTHAPNVMAVLAGIAVPFLAFGRIAMAALLLLAVLALLRMPGQRDAWRTVFAEARSPFGIMVLVMVALWLPAVWVSPLPLRSLDAWVRVPVFIGLATLLWAMLSSQQTSLSLTLKALLIAGAVGATFALISLTVLPTEVLAFIRLKGWNPEAVRAPDVFKAYANMGILLVPVGLWAGWRIGGRWRALAMLLATGLLVVVWLTHSRAAMAGLFLMLVVGGGLTVAVRHDATVTAVFFVMVLAVASALAWWLHDVRGSFQVPPGAIAVLPTWLIDYQRQTIWAHAIRIGMSSPWIGNGINVINLLPEATTRLPTNILNVIPSHPHNWLIEVFAETGAVGAAALLTVVIAFGLKCAGEFLKLHDPAPLALLLAHVGFWGSGLFNFSFWSAWWQVGYIMLTVFCLAGRHRPADDATPSG
ncbi:MAG: O-antigen ligase family protein [Rhodospirillales bacterium]|nr:O-antigen ligase family protein [Rhodospirillales bacterium]